jgi:hypothetical protein
MRDLLLLSAAVAAIAACKPPTYVEPMPEEMDPPVPPPEFVIRMPVNYSFKADNREYRLRLFSDENEGIQDDIVTVIDGGAYERYATKNEFEYAMGVFIQNWVQAGLEAQLEYHRRLFEREEMKRATTLDDRITRKTEQIAKLKGDRWDRHADAESRRATGYKEKEGPDSLPFLQQEVARLDVMIAAEEARLRVLEYERYQRDSGVSLSKLASDIEKAKKGLLDE